MCNASKDKTVVNIFDDFIDISITYDLYDEYIYDFLTKNKSFSRDILV